jgi:gas vesicle protein
MINSKVFWGIVTAAAVGAVIGLVLSPDDGERIKKKIKRKTNSLADDLITALEKSKDKAAKLKAKGEKLKDDLVDAAEEKAEELSDKVKNS